MPDNEEIKDEERVKDDCGETTGKDSDCLPGETIKIINADVELPDEPAHSFYSSPCLLSEMEEDEDILKR